MKITLEHKLPPCPDRLTCTVCRQTFEVSRLRTLLRSDRGLVIGDICPHCLHLAAYEIQRLLRYQANQMMAHPKGRGAQTIASHRQALELLEISTENVQFPMVYQRWLKWIAIFAQESQELESARFNLSSYDDQKRSQLEKIFMHSPEDL
jgi:hypothetical protein